MLCCLLHVTLSVLVEGCVQFQVGGNTLYNMLKLGEGETDVNEKPRYPHTIVKTRVKISLLIKKQSIFFIDCNMYVFHVYCEI